MVNEIKEIIEDYFSLTGRPLATMTVEEYLSFLNSIRKEPNKTAVFSPGYTKASASEPPSAIIMQTPENTAFSQTATPPIQKNTKEEIKATKENDQISPKSDPLQMLKSIAG